MNVGVQQAGQSLPYVQATYAAGRSLESSERVSFAEDISSSSNVDVFDSLLQQAGYAHALSSAESATSSLFECAQRVVNTPPAYVLGRTTTTTTTALVHSWNMSAACDQQLAKPAPATPTQPPAATTPDESLVHSSPTAPPTPSSPAVSPTSTI